MQLTLRSPNSQNLHLRQNRRQRQLNRLKHRSLSFLIQPVPHRSLKRKQRSRRLLRRRRRNKIGIALNQVTKQISRSPRLQNISREQSIKPNRRIELLRRLIQRLRIMHRRLTRERRQQPKPIFPRASENFVPNRNVSSLSILVKKVLRLQRRKMQPKRLTVHRALQHDKRAHFPGCKLQFLLNNLNHRLRKRSSLNIGPQNPLNVLRMGAHFKSLQELLARRKLRLSQHKWLKVVRNIAVALNCRQPLGKLHRLNRRLDLLLVLLRYFIPALQNCFD